MNKKDKKLQQHLLEEMIKVSETNPDVMYYMEALMKSYEELEQENIKIKQQLLENKISLKDVEYQEKIKYKNIINEAIEYINENKHLSMFADCREPEEDWNYALEVNPRELLNILKGE